MKLNPQISTTMHRTKRLLLVSCLCLGIPAQAQTINAAYDVFAGKSKIGAFDVARQNSNLGGVPTTVIDTAMQLRVKTFLSSYALDTKEHVVMGPKGVITYLAENNDNGNKSQIEGHLEADEFFLKIQEGEKTYSFPLPPLGYDPAMLVLMEHPASDTPKDGAFKFLDPDTFEFQNEHRSDRGKETMAVAGNTFSCQVIDFETPASSGTRWIAEDALGSFLVKEVGRDQDGPYSFLMTAYSSLP